jgi:hypothetical protein
MTMAAMSCGGGGGGTVDLAPASPSSGTSNMPDVVKGTGILIHEDEIASLPAWQQELLSDPGWNQPYIAPRAETEITPPSSEALMAAYQEMLEGDWTINPRGLGGGKGASWMDDGGYDHVTQVVWGEFENVAVAGTPPYGCNNDGGLGGNGHALDDVIRAGNKNLADSCCYVLRGHTVANWFNPTGGSGNDAASAVYQIYSASRASIPDQWEWYDENMVTPPEFEELSYRADLAPGVGVGGDCSAAEAFLVTGIMWKRFNTPFNVLPGLQQVHLYDVLVAPSGEELGPYYSLDAAAAPVTEGTYQEFYLGTIGGCYDGAMIVGLQSSTSGCEVFDNSVADAYGDVHPFHYTPIYGVLLQRWQDMVLAGQSGAWESALGWPVLGPRGNGASQISPTGAYYKWEMWFEHGYMAWLDYDQAAYPMVPDEAQVYNWVGSPNVFCYGETGQEYQYLAPAVYYGGSGPLALVVVVDSQRDTALDPWVPVGLDAGGTYYELPMTENDGVPSGVDPVNVAMHAHPYGGDGGSDCTYSYYTWAYRDGTIFMGNEASAKYVTHTYGSTSINMEGIYTVRVQVVDQSGDIAYGDTLPIHLGHGGGGAAADPEVLIVRNDGGLAEANLLALEEDLATLGTAWATLDYDNPPGGWTSLLDHYNTLTQLMVVIWYHGGTGEGEVGAGPFMDPWTEAEMDDFIMTLNEGYHVLQVDPFHGHLDHTNAWYNWISDGIPTFVGQHLPANPISNPPSGWGMKLDKAASSHGDYYAAIPGYFGDVVGFTPASAVPWGNLGLCGPDDAAGAQRAEIYDGSGSSGWRPLTIQYDDKYQISVMGVTTGMLGATNGFFVPGINLDVMYGPWWNLHDSWGNTMAPDEGKPYGYSGGPSYTTGPSRLWVMGYAYGPINITSTNKPSGTMERYELLNNVLAWLDDGLTFGGGGSGGAGSFDDYAGDPEIIQVMIGNWEEDADGGFFKSTPTVAYTYDGTNAGSLAVYPDQTGTDVYRSSGFYDENNFNYVISASANNDWINGNDVPFQYPGWYAYVTDVDGDGVELGDGNLDDDTVFFGGLLCEDPADDWARDYTLVSYDVSASPTHADVPSVICDNWSVSDPWPNVGGYYVSTTGDTGAVVRAQYGTQGAHHAFNNDDELAAEVVVHWDRGT